MIENFWSPLVAERKAILMALFISLEGAITLPHSLLKAGVRAGPAGNLLDLLVASVLGIAFFLGLRHAYRRPAGALPETRLRRIAARSGALLPLLLALAATVVLLSRGWWRFSDLWLVILIVNSLVLTAIHGWAASRAAWPLRIALIALAAAVFYVYASFLRPFWNPFYFWVFVIQTGALFVLQAGTFQRAFWLLCVACLLSMYWSTQSDFSAFDRYRFDNLFWPARLPDEMRLSGIRDLLATLRQSSWFGGSSVLPLQDAATQWGLPSHLEKFGLLSLGVVLASVFYWFFLVRPRRQRLATNSRRAVFACALWIGLLLTTVINVCGSLALIQEFDSRVPLFAADLSLILAAWMLMASTQDETGSAS